ncbi:MAG: GH1 family beta-glucosidase [Myxococcota bacterium]
MKYTFPADFVWGAATSSYQIEGATRADGRGPSIWDTFAATPGAIKDGTNGDVACDHYHRYPEDVALMRSLGLQAYRFSIAWPRIVPDGTGLVEARGLDFYDRLVDTLLAAGITPWATLYHWDLPQPLEDLGGWPVRTTAEAFVPYVDAVTRRLGDRVKHWITHNEPWCASVLGYLSGEHAPGRKEPAAALAAAHHLLLSHGMAVPVVRSNSPGAKVGITLNLNPATPASPSDLDAEAARKFDGTFNRWFLDPVHGHGYPKDVVDDHAAEGIDALAEVRPGDLDTIAVATDFLGVNYYTRHIARGPEAGNLPRVVEEPGPAARTDIGWEVHAESLRALLVRLATEYPPQPLFITENGAATFDGPGADGRIADPRRVRYLAEHLEAVAAARAEGARVDGYFAWSLMDNFEWAWGYTQRFGLVWVDYATQARVPKDSAFWYRDVIARGGFDFAVGTPAGG